MIQCETCKCWQHCVCMGMHTEEDCPDVYYCEQCKPELHIPLLRSLGLLPPPRSHKKGAGKASKNPARDAAREIKEAREAAAAMAAANAARRREAAEAAASTAGSRDRATRQTSSGATADRSGRSNSRDLEQKHPPKSPKRRSTMNSRDSAYGGWEAIPPGLLAEGETWDGEVAELAEAEREKEERERKDRNGKKRKRPSRDDTEG